MDPDAKKQRRRSIRNLRRSACFIPPAVSYGSAWIGDNQETNICNLVQSFEELNCRDDRDNDGYVSAIGSSQQLEHPLKQYENDDACDGFSSDYLSNRESTVLLDHGKVQQLPDLNTIGSGHVQETSQPTNNFLSSVDASCIMPSNESDASVDIMCSDGGSITENLVQIFNNCESNDQSIESSDSFYKECSKEQYNIVSKACLSDCNEDNKQKYVEGTIKDQSAFCSTVSDTESEHPHLSQQLLDNSMSPEFSDVCPNSADSSPLINPMDMAINSFLDVSSGNFLNMSFSPVDVRPDTPKMSSSVRWFANSNAKLAMEEDVLHRSISNIISSIEEPIVSADPSTLDKISENGDISPCIPIKSNSITFSSLDTNAPSVLSDQLNRTYTLEEEAELGGVGHKHFPEQNEIQNYKYFSEQNEIQSPVSTHNEEDLIMLDFDFVKTKSKRRASSIFTPKENSNISCHSISVDPTSIALSQTDKEESVMDCGGDENICAVNKSNMNGSDFGLQSHGSKILDNGVLPNHNHIDTDNTCNTLSSLSPLQSTLTDCDNVVESNQQVKTKKQRRKSNKLVQLLQESERFLIKPSSDNEERVISSHGGDNSDKENENNEDMDMQEFSIKENSTFSRVSNKRTRRSRKSWDFQKVSKQEDSSHVESLVVKDYDESSCEDLEVGNLQSVYGKQKYVPQSPTPLETIKEVSTEKNIFLKKKVKRYLDFSSVTGAKAKKRTKKAFSVYNGRQCFFSVTDQEFDQKMLDVQIALDSDLFSVI